MKERPILFSAPMVRALLDGTKTQTRRIVKPQPRGDVFFDGQWLDHGYGEAGDTALHCPYGQPGDRLWVRETWGYRGSCWSTDKPEVQEVSIHYRADDGRRHFTRAKDDDSGLPKQRECRPDEDYVDDYYNGYLDRYWKAWRPSIHMPRWASRITLEVTEVRLERLQAISEADAIAEGVDPAQGLLGDDDLAVHHVMTELAPPGQLSLPAPLARFVLLWDSINGKQPGVTNWNANPWVWAVSFRPVELGQ